MHVVLVSNCEKAALLRTRTILDRYATRIGNRAWATRITQAALDELWMALKRSASRYTSVACYRSDATVGLRLVWIVGNRHGYDPHERFAIAIHQKKKEFPMPFRHAALVAQLAGYTHDFGKASQRFQDKLRASLTASSKDDPAWQADPVRHEWLSAWLLAHLLSHRQSGDSVVDANTLTLAWQAMRDRESDPDGPIKIPAPVATPITNALQAAGWAVCTHHGAMGGELTQPVLSNSEHVRAGNPLANLALADQDAFSMASDPQDAQRWRELFASINKTVERPIDLDRPPAYWEGVMLMARAALILADHKVSSQDYVGPAPRSKDILYANTKSVATLQPEKPSLRPRKPKTTAATPVRRLDQPLSWHLQQVGEKAAANLRMMAGDGLPVIDPTLVREVLERRAPEGSRFAWQDKAVDHVRQQSGARLVFNVASTGAGKTLANLKIAFALRPDAARLAVAFNLRSLTTQTFAAFGKHLSSIDQVAFARDFACLMGFSSATDSQHDVAARDQKIDIEGTQSEDVIELNGNEGLTLPEWIKDFAKGSSSEVLAKLIASPALVSTMDWIVAAGEPGTQDRHAKAFIRVANSDLILDEVDSFDVKAAVAVMRVVQIAAMFGRNVIVSSATLNPALAEGLCLAYAKGREVHDAMFGAKPWHLTLVSNQFEPCSLTSPNPEQAINHYRDVLKAAAQNLRSAAPTKRYRIAQVNSETEFFEAIVAQAAALHERSAFTPKGLQCRVSIGLVRVANIKPCMNIAEKLKDDGRFIVTAYHAQEVDKRRAEKERLLDKILDRNSDDWVDALCDELPWLKTHEGDVRLIVVATPVEEVGRDHDFDWAIIEPSSMHSIIQTAGRVNRHRRRPLGPDDINICLLSRNLRDLRGESIAFTKPGLEADHRGQSTHSSHDLCDLMQTDDGCNNDVMDAGLVFDEGGRKTRFAHDDEKAVRLHIARAMPIIARNIGYETHFMVDKFAREFPLRDSLLKTEYVLDMESLTFARAMDPGTPIGKIVEMDTSSERHRSVWLTRKLRDLAVQGMLRVEQTEYGRGNQAGKIEVTWHGVLFL